jgi:hypothetical protein
MGSRLAGELKRAAKLISLFVAGHSLTLLTATSSTTGTDATTDGPANVSGSRHQTRRRMRSPR